MTAASRRNTAAVIKIEPAREPRPWLPASAIVVLTFLAYLPAFRCGFIWDDDDYVTQNQTLHDANGLKRIWLEPRSTPQYYPLVFSTFWVEHQLWGDSPAGYHIINFALHGANAILLWQLLRLLRIPGAWLAAILFSVHPVQVESVAWITERKNVLSAFFYLSAALVYFRLMGANQPADSSGKRSGISGKYTLSFALYFCGLLSKTVACTLPAAILLITWWRNRRLQHRDISRVLPMFAVGLLAALATIWIEREHVGAAGPEFAFSFSQRCLIAGRAVWFYLAKLAWPYPLTFIYPRWKTDAADVAQWIFPLAAILLLFLLWSLRRKITAAPLVACLFFGGTLLPALGFINIYPMRYSFVADHFQYLASIGPIALFAAAMTRLALHTTAAIVLRGFSIVLIATFIALTWRQSTIYADEETLWQATLRHNPEAWIAWNNLGYIHAQHGRLNEGITMMEKAVSLNPNFAEGRSNLGGFLLQRNQLPQAYEQLSEAVRLDPKISAARGNLGVVVLHMGDPTSAESHLREALRLDPKNFTAQYNLGSMLLAAGRVDEAVEHLSIAVELDPADTELQASLKKALEQKRSKR